jgi:predicted O-methyltransferase YrrM
LIQTKAYRELLGDGVPMQSILDSILIHLICGALQPVNILEIGFKKGYSLGLILESLEGPAHLTTVDIEHGSALKEFVELYKEELVTRDLSFITKDSRHLLDVKEPYDFIHVDGNHDYEFVKSDIEYGLRNISIDGVIAIDDSQRPEVQQAIRETILKSDYRVFLKGFSQTFWTYKDHNPTRLLPEDDNIVLKLTEYLGIETLQATLHQR